MSEVAWLPALLVLGIGLAIGVAASIGVRRSRKHQTAVNDGQELLLRDLEGRRDDLYARLRSPDLEPGDRESLELAAAHTLRELDRLAPGRVQTTPPPTETQPSTAAPEKGPLPLGGRHAALVGFVSGMAVVLLVGGLIYLAIRDSGAGQDPRTATASPETPHPDESALPAEVQRELAQLEAAAAAAPNDLLARKRLALGRLDAGLYFEAFSDAEAILASQPEDPDGLYIQGVVRLSMGRAGEALELLDRVLARYPEHLRAMIYRGLALAQGGDLDQAIDTWEVALEMAGGSHPDIESLLQQAQAQLQQAAAPAPPPPAAAAAAPPPAPAQPAPQSAAAAADPAAPDPAAPDPDVYQVTVDLATGRSLPPSTVLFVFLRTGDSGPPSAVKRIPAPRFPMQLTLGADDAMMAGTALPEQGILVARLSTSGSASARGPDDLEATSPATVGQAVRLTLGGL